MHQARIAMSYSNGLGGPALWHRWTDPQPGAQRAASTWFAVGSKLDAYRPRTWDVARLTRGVHYQL